LKQTSDHADVDINLLLKYFHVLKSPCTPILSVFGVFISAPRLLAQLSLLNLAHSSKANYEHSDSRQVLVVGFSARNSNHETPLQEKGEGA
jgi:hypothetical protein